MQTIQQNKIPKITNEEEKKLAIEKIKVLKRKLEGTDPELVQMQKDLSQLEAELQATIERLSQPINALKEKIRQYNQNLKEKRNEMRKEFDSLKDAVLVYELGENHEDKEESC